MMGNYTEKAKEHISKMDAITLLELIYQCGSCSTLDDTHAIMEKINSLLGFDKAIYVLAKYNASGSITSYNNINFSYPQEWLKLYREHHFYDKDPIAKENFSRFGLQYWKDTKKKYKIDEDYLSVTEDFGIINGYSYGTLNASKTEGCLLSVAGKFSKSHREVYILNNLSPHLHIAFSGIIRKQNTNKSLLQISIREKEVLNWVSKGKSTWDVSVILNISERTVKFHVNSIMKKLNAVSRIHAVAIATSLGLIETA